jgi:hypothetical protein
LEDAITEEIMKRFFKKATKDRLDQKRTDDARRFYEVMFSKMKEWRKYMGTSSPGDVAPQLT